MTSAGLDWAREKWKFGVGSKFIRQGEKNAVKYADEIIVLSKGVQKYFMDTYGRETHFIPNGVNRPEVREAKLIKDHFGLEKDSYILFLGRLVPEKGIRYLVEAFKNVKTDKKLVIAGGSSDTDSFILHFNNYKRKEVITMPRTKGSKNKPKIVTADFATQIAEKQSAKEILTAEVASITANIDTLKADLKAKKAALKKAEKEVATLEAKKAKADAKAAEEAKKAEAESVLKKLLASGMSADEILEKLK